jgi:primosomal protein N' (replication factor Y)
MAFGDLHHSKGFPTGEKWGEGAKMNGRTAQGRLGLLTEGRVAGAQTVWYLRCMYVEVAFALPLNKTFHYKTDNGTEPANPYIGRRVLAPFGNKTMIGYVVGTTTETPSFPVKPIHTWVDPQPLLDATFLELAEWMAKKYLCSTGEALSAILPGQLRAPKRALKASPPAPLPTGEGGPSKTTSEAIRLSDEQTQVLSQFLKAADEMRFQPFLLRGITDSGKTELYLRTIDHVMKQGRQAIFLLPEIALTPPFIDRLQARYGGDTVGLWHSGIGAGERYRLWEKARSGELRVLLGARSAVFAPFPHLGAIIMDEEHESSYKQEDRPRYHARDVALWRAERSRAVMIMGGATPSLESYWAAKKGVYTLVELTSRVELRQLPQVTLIDRRGKGEGGKERKAGFAVFSEPMKLAIEQRLARREQVILFVNRRGFTPFLRCSKCGWVARCERCSLALALHVKGGGVPRFQGKNEKMPVPADSFLQCPSCVREYPVPTQCSACKSMRLGHFGIGTQRVEQEVKEHFPFVKIARLDRDVGHTRSAYEKIYRRFMAKELDMLVGTQIIAKGFDFPGVTLVGVIDADITLHLPDFRAAERTFQLLAQVGGRTGRGDLGGKVLVQTHHPEHYALQAAKEHDYLRFYAEEIPHRESLNYPPFCHLVHLVIRGRKEVVALEAADALAEQLINLGGDVQVLGPAPAPHARVRGQFRHQIVLKGSESALAPYLEFLRGRRLSKAFLTVDKDPTDLI